MIRLSLIVTMLLVFIESGRTAAEPDRIGPRSHQWQKVLDQTPFKFDGSDANILGSLSRFEAKCKIEMIFDPADRLRLAITFIRDGKKILSLNGQPASVFLTSGDVLCFADYSAIGNGCTVDAYDLASGRSLWKRHLTGIGSIGHSEYTNAVTMNFSDGGGIENNREAAIVVAGHEASGDYVEVLDVHTGTVLAQRVYRSDAIETKK